MLIRITLSISSKIVCFKKISSHFFDTQERKHEHKKLFQVQD